MKKNKKYLLSLIIIATAYIAAIFIAEYYIEKKINSEYQLKYNDFNFSLTTNLRINGLEFSKNGFHIKAEKVKANPGLWSSLFSGETVVDKVSLYNAEVVYQKNTEPSQKSSQSQSSDFELKNISLNNLNAIVLEGKDTLAYAQNLNAKLSYPLHKDLDVSVLDDFETQELFYKLDKIQDLRVYHLIKSRSNFKIDSLHIDSKYTKENYIQQLDKEKDLITHKSYNLELNDFSFNAIDGQLRKLSFAEIEIDSSRTLIYRDKTIADDNSIKKTYGQNLQNLNFDINIEEINLINSELTYSEKLSKKKVSEIVFKDLNVSLKDLHNIKENSDKQMKLLGELSLNPESKLNVAIAYNQFADVETFQLKLDAANVNTRSLNKIMKPTMNFGLEGYFKKIEAQMISQKNAKGDFNLTAQDVELTMYSDSGREKKIMSFMANKLLNNNISEKIEIEEVERDPTKSMWNYIWNYIKKGLTKILL